VGLVPAQVFGSRPQTPTPTQLPSSRAMTKRTSPTRRREPAATSGPDADGVAQFIRAHQVATSADLRSALGINGYYVRKAVDELRRAGKVRVSGVKRGTKYHWCSDQPPIEWPSGVANSIDTMVDEASTVIDDGAPCEEISGRTDSAVEAQRQHTTSLASQQSLF